MADVTRREAAVEGALAAGLAIAAVAIAAGFVAAASGLAATEARRAWRHSRATPDRGSVPAERHRQTRSAAAR